MLDLTGTGVALVTPFDAKGEIDYEALERVIGFVIEGGVDYLVSLGTTGETPTLGRDEKKEILQFTCEKAKGRVPVVAGIGGNNTRELIKDLEDFPLDKVAGVLSASPYYSKPSQEGLFLHYRELARASPRPLILYNVPARTGRNLEAGTTLRLSEVANIAGIKEAGGDMAQCMKILRDAPAAFQVVSGDDALAFPQIAAGMKGVISVAANAFPREFSGMVRDALTGKLKEAKKANDALIDAYDLMFAENNPAGVKAFMAEAGLIGNHFRLPVSPVGKSLQEKIAAHVAHTRGRS